MPRRLPKFFAGTLRQREATSRIQSATLPVAVVYSRRRDRPKRQRPYRSARDRKLLALADANLGNDGLGGPCHARLCARLVCTGVPLSDLMPKSWQERAA